MTEPAGPGEPQTGENTCPACAGTGQVEGQEVEQRCGTCAGSGTVTEVVGDA